MPEGTTRWQRTSVALPRARQVPGARLDREPGNWRSFVGQLIERREIFDRPAKRASQCLEGTVFL